jgi:hypothetical protein
MKAWVLSRQVRDGDVLMIAVAATKSGAKRAAHKHYGRPLFWHNPTTHYMSLKEIDMLAADIGGSTYPERVRYYIEPIKVAL